MKIDGEFYSMERIAWEKRTVSHMIELWCRKNHGGQELCSECSELLDYSLARLDHCKFGAAVTASLRHTASVAHSAIRR